MVALINHLLTYLLTYRSFILQPVTSQQLTAYRYIG